MSSARSSRKRMRRWLACEPSAERTRAGGATSSYPCAVMIARLLSPVVCAAALVAAVVAQQPSSPTSPSSDGLRFRYMGPESAGRISAVVGIPGDTQTYYAGAASGGVWKTTDGAKTFEPVFDDQPVQAIGALEVGESDPRIVWAGTGEAWTIRDSDVTGDGVYKSTDAGKTWTHIGLD